MKKHKIMQPKNVIEVLREQYHLSEEQLLNLQICAFEAIRETIVSACNDGRIYKVHLLFTGFDSDSGNELKIDIYMRCEEKITQSITISPLLREKTAVQTVNEVLDFIADNFRKNSLSSILDYFKITQKMVGGLVLYN